MVIITISWTELLIWRTKILCLSFETIFHNWNHSIKKIKYYKNSKITKIIKRFLVNFWIQDLFKNRGLTLETSDSEFLTSSFIWLKHFFWKKNQNRHIYSRIPEGPVGRHPYDMVHIYFYELIAVIKQAYKSKKS